jgi:hypothetical protein
MEDRDKTQTMDNIRRLAGEKKVNEYVKDNKTLSCIFPEMHAIPEYI